MRSGIIRENESGPDVVRLLLFGKPGISGNLGGLDSDLGKILKWTE